MIKMKLTDYFGDYKNNNLKILQDYMNLLNKELENRKFIILVVIFLMALKFLIIKNVY